MRLRRNGLGALAWIFVATGCSGPTAPPPPPSGGEEFLLSYEDFQASVAPVFTEFGCNTTECHGGGIRGTFQLSPVDAPDPDFDFDQARLQVDPYDRPASALLQKPLAQDAGGSPHSFEPFDTTEHSGYRALEAWILAGEFE
ncbi:MAG: hypothetical protein HKN12_07725 [Gemmatimonadetes bacterium]|nr:hypothetical protein [Gemmatimonadota bacterium]